MTLRKYLAGLALLFAIPGGVLLALGYGIAWAFLIIAGFLGIGALATHQVTPQEELELEEIWQENLWASDPNNPASPTYDR